jgi:hypothetical protein
MLELSHDLQGADMECLGRSTDNIRTPLSPDFEASRVRPRVSESVGIVIEHSSSAGQLQADSRMSKTYINAAHVTSDTSTGWASFEGLDARAWV